MLLTLEFHSSLSLSLLLREGQLTRKPRVFIRDLGMKSNALGF